MPCANVTITFSYLLLKVSKAGYKPTACLIVTTCSHLCMFHRNNAYIEYPAGAYIEYPAGAEGAKDITN